MPIRQNIAWLVSLTVILVFVSGCKASSWQKSDKDKDRLAAGSVAEPKRVGQADAAGAVPGVIEVDEKTGRTRQSLVLRLDYFPDAEAGGTNLPACYGAFPSTFELGVYMCANQTDKPQVLLAGHVAQDCYTNPRFERVQALSPLKFTGCARGMFVLHSFDPPLRVDVEQRETM